MHTYTWILGQLGATQWQFFIWAERRGETVPLQAAQLIAAYSADIATDWMQSAQQHPLPVSQIVQDISVYECNGVCYFKQVILAQTENTLHWLEHFSGRLML